MRGCVWPDLCRGPQDGSAPLHVAGNAAVVEKLLAKGAAIDTTDMLENLLAVGAAIDTTDMVRGKGSCGARIGRGRVATRTSPCHFCLRSCVVEVRYREGHGRERGHTHLREKGGHNIENAARRRMETPRCIALRSAATRRWWRSF